MDAARIAGSLWRWGAPVIAKHTATAQDYSRQRGGPVLPSAVPVDVGDERIRFEESSAR